MRREFSLTLIAIFLILLLFSVYMQVSVLPSAVEGVIAKFPEVARLSFPAVIWGVIAIACWQVVAVIGIRLTVLARNHNFTAASHGWLRATVLCLLVFVVLVVSALISLVTMGYATPGVMLGLIGGGLMALTALGSLILFLGTRPYRGHYPRNWHSSPPIVE